MLSTITRGYDFAQAYNESLLHAHRNTVILVTLWTLHLHQNCYDGVRLFKDESMKKGKGLPRRHRAAPKTSALRSPLLSFRSFCVTFLPSQTKPAGRVTVTSTLSHVDDSVSGERREQAASS